MCVNQDLQKHNRKCEKRKLGQGDDGEHGITPHREHTELTDLRPVVGLYPRPGEAAEALLSG